MTNIKIIEAIIYPTSVRRCGVRRACIECQESLLWPGWRPYFRSVYGWCSEGFNTVDLKEAKALLDELAACKFFRLEERELNPSPTRMSMKKIGFLSFGHWTPSPQSQTRSASDALVQSIDLTDNTRWQLLEECQHIATLQLPADNHIAFCVGAVDLKHRFGDVETDCRNSLHNWLLRIVGASTAPTSMALNVPVEEPSTASDSDMHHRIGAKLRPRQVVSATCGLSFPR